MRITAVLGAAGVVVLLAMAQFVALVLEPSDSEADGAYEGGIAGVPAWLEGQAPEADRSTEVYAGYGTWVDVYDYVPVMTSGAPAVTSESVDEMRRQGVGTLYLQAAKLDPDLPELLADPVVVAQMLVQAHQAGIRVVGWYLPTFTDLDRDLAHLQAIADFEVLGHRFDGVAVDIEATGGIADHRERSNKLVELSERLRDGMGDEAVGAIVLPPVQLEVINPNKWPNFPWEDLADLYDVWLPMGYWTERRADSGYRDGQTYTDENVRRLRANLDDPDALVHAIGGIGDEVTPDQATQFAQTVEDVDAMGGSIYDWATLERGLHDRLAALQDH